MVYAEQADWVGKDQTLDELGRVVPGDRKPPPDWLLALWAKEARKRRPRNGPVCPTCFTTMGNAEGATCIYCDQ
jgi:hypothetical protein